MKWIIACFNVVCYLPPVFNLCRSAPFFCFSSLAFHLLLFALHVFFFYLYLYLPVLFILFLSTHTFARIVKQPCKLHIQPAVLGIFTIIITLYLFIFFFSRVNIINKCPLKAFQPGIEGAFGFGLVRLTSNVFDIFFIFHW